MLLVSYSSIIPDPREVKPQAYTLWRVFYQIQQKGPGENKKSRKVPETRFIYLLSDFSRNSIQKSNTVMGTIYSFAT